MKILVVGGGGREHAIIRSLKKSPLCGEIWCAPGNGGISYDAKCKDIKATDVEAMVAFAQEEAFSPAVLALMEGCGVQLCPYDAVFDALSSAVAAVYKT